MLCKRLLGLSIAAILGCLAGTAAAATPSRLFVDDAPLKLSITAPFPALERTARSNTASYPASLSFSEAGAPERTLAVQLAPRGKTRRTGGYCSFPPLALEFRKGTARGTPFHGQHRLKLVTYCNPGRDYEQRVVLEYLAYRMLNVLTPASFRVRKVEVTYRTRPDDAGTTRTGFLIEPQEAVADRNGREVLQSKSFEVSPTQLERRAAARAALFQFMISNLDWEFLAAHPGEACCHNMRLLGSHKAVAASATQVVPVPYDFDFSGLVDAPYAQPPEQLEKTEGITTTKERYYRGYCASTPEVAAAAGEFRTHKAAILAMINGEPSLTDAYKARAARFIEGFYAVIDDPAQFDRKVVKHCR